MHQAERLIYSQVVTMATFVLHGVDLMYTWRTFHVGPLPEETAKWKQKKEIKVRKWIRKTGLVFKYLPFIVIT